MCRGQWGWSSDEGLGEGPHHPLVVMTVVGSRLFLENVEERRLPLLGKKEEIKRAWHVEA